MDDAVLNVVQNYKHLGSVTSASGSSAAFVRARAAAGMAAFAPIASKVLSNPLFSYAVRSCIGDSLVLSALLHNCKVRVLKASELSIINAVYMKVLRRLAHQARYATGGMTDFQVRELLGAPSIDCVMLRQRVSYLARLVASEHSTLKSLIGARHPNGAMVSKWAAQLRSDLRRLWCGLEGVRAVLADPELAPGTWHEFMRAQPAVVEGWLRDYIFLESVCDDKLEGEVGDDLVCDICAHQSTKQPPKFKCARALLTHKRVVHGIRNHMRLFADRDGVCPICKGQYMTRIRLVAHLSDKRRTKCHDQIVEQSLPQLSPARVAELDEEDRVARRAAQRAGLSHVPAAGQARRADGRAVGRVQS